MKLIGKLLYSLRHNGVVVSMSALHARLLHSIPELCRYVMGKLIILKIGGSVSFMIYMMTYM